jgi:hypothetical protein
MQASRAALTASSVADVETIAPRSRVRRAIADKKQLPPAALKELARQFGGSVPGKSTRPAIAEFLKMRRLEMQRQEGLAQQSIGCLVARKTPNHAARNLIEGPLPILKTPITPVLAMLR